MSPAELFTVALGVTGQGAAALSYILLHLFLCLAAAWLGIVLARLF